MVVWAMGCGHESRRSKVRGLHVNNRQHESPRLSTEDMGRRGKLPGPSHLAQVLANLNAAPKFALQNIKSLRLSGFPERPLRCTVRVLLEGGRQIDSVFDAAV